MSVKFLTEVLADGYPEEYGEVIYTTGWMSDGKYERCSDVIKIAAEDVAENPELVEGFYRCNGARSGSYYSDYEYSPYHVEEVEPYEEAITVTKWRVK